MSPRIRKHVLDVVVLGVIGWSIFSAMSNPKPPSKESAFASKIDVEPLRRIAVHDAGRVKSFDSFARTTVKNIAGRKGINDQDPVFAYMDLMFNGGDYVDQNIIYVKKAIRPQMIRVMHQIKIPAEEIESFRDTGMISENLIRQPEMIDELIRLDADVIRTAKFVNRIEAALSYADPLNLSGRLNIIPPPSGDDQAPWSPGQALWGTGFLSGRMADASAARSIPGLDDQLAGTLVTNWNNLVSGWRAQDAEKTNQAMAALADNLAKISPELYPDTAKLNLEAWYFRMHTFVWNWIVYILAAVPLLLSVIYRWKNAYRLGVFILLIAFVIHTASLGIRWYLSGRIPNSNMYEAILAATWFGVLGAFFLEFWIRKTAMRGLFFLGSAVCSMVAMMCQHFMPTTLSADIDNVMPVLNDVWLYIHTNVIIFSYALIGMAAITALLYLRHRIGGGDPTVARAGGAGSIILDGTTAKGNSFLKAENTASAGQVLDASTMVLMELAFIMLWAGLVMGAIWADHSWGRPWGWDPKEVFALCTFVIFLLLVHVRLKVRDKGLWTAVLAVVGCGVMLFNWIVINFYISGLHSYA